MKLTLSKQGDPRGRHVVLVVEPSEDWAAAKTIQEEILKGKVKPVREKSGDVIMYRFALKWLDFLLLAFPFAELSPGVHRRLKRAEELRLEGFRTPDLDIPGFKGTLYDYQKIGVAMLTDPDYAKEHGSKGGVIDFLNDEMGLGKTYQILAAIAILDAYPALCVVPNNAKYTAWGEVIEEFYPDLTYAIYDTQEQSPAERDALLRERRDITIVNIEAIRARAIHKDDNPNKPIIDWEYANPALFDFTYEYAVLDEHHRVKTPYAQVTNGFFQLDAEDWWCPMSGTPILNRPEEIWTVLHKTYPDKFPSYEGFIQDIGIVIGGKIVAYKPDRMRELRDFLQDRTLRRRADQVIKDRPKVVTINRSVVLSAEERKIYDRIEDEMILEMEDGSIRNIGGALPKITRLKQACFSPELFGGSKKSSKVEELKEIVSELVASGEKAIIFSQWETAARILLRELEQWNPAYVTGKVKNKDRGEQQRKFNEDDDCHLYIGTIDANREAINLGVATYVIFTDEGWVPAADDQAIGRSAAGGLRGAHLGSDSTITVIMLQAEDTYEQNSVVLMKGKKRNLFDRTVERDGGKEREIQAATTSLADLRASLSKRSQKKSKPTTDTSDKKTPKKKDKKKGKK